MQAIWFYIFNCNYSMLSIYLLWKYLPIRHFLHIYWETCVNPTKKPGAHAVVFAIKATRLFLVLNLDKRRNVD